MFLSAAQSRLKNRKETTFNFAIRNVLSKEQSVQECDASKV